MFLLFLFVLDLEFGGVKYKSVSYMWQVIFFYISVKGRIVNPYEDGLFYVLGMIAPPPCS